MHLRLEIVALVPAFAVLATNQIHCWSHVENSPRIVRSIQHARFNLHPEVHAHHHRDSFDRAYCVTIGWTNSILDLVTRNKPGSRS